MAFGATRRRFGGLRKIGGERALKESAPVDRVKARIKIAPIVLCQWMAGGA